MKFSVIFSILLAIFMFQCKQSTEPFPGEVFQYTSYDSSGNALVNGWFTMNFADSANITGEWHFQTINSPKNIGPQVGDGNLVGEANDGQIWVELNPQYKDNNLQLIGTMTNKRFTGRWMWLSFSGVTNAGTFESVKK
jgi:hypothetical protein